MTADRHPDPNIDIHNKKERPKSARAKPVVVGGTMGFMSWLAEAKSKAETESGDEEFVASDEETALEIVGTEVADQSPELMQVCRFRTRQDRKQYESRNRAPILAPLTDHQST